MEGRSGCGGCATCALPRRACSTAIRTSTGTVPAATRAVLLHPEAPSVDCRLPSLHLALPLLAGAAPPAPLAITCSDILMLLEEGPEQGLNARVLFDAFCHGADSSSNDLAAAGAPAAAAQEHPHHARHHHSNHHRHSHPQHQHQHAHVPHQQVAVAAL